MININPMLLCDFYKTTHSKQFPAGTTKLVSYFTPRMSRLDGVDEVVVFGIQAFRHSARIIWCNISTTTSSTNQKKWSFPSINDIWMRPLVRMLTI